MKLDLNWKLETVEERIEFANMYIDMHEEALTPSNLETISDYILWATDSSDIQLEAKASPWRKQVVDTSLDALFERANETGFPVELLIQGEGVGKSSSKLMREDVVSLLGTKASLDFKWNRLGETKEEVELVKVYGKIAMLYAIVGRSNPINSTHSSETSNSINSDKTTNSINSAKTTNSQSSLADSGHTSEIHKTTNSQPALADLECTIDDLHPLAADWVHLWRRIDRIEYMVQTWEAAMGKRRADLPIRYELELRIDLLRLLNQSGDSREELRAEALNWDAYTFLRHKRLLVSLRKEQYILLDGTKGETIQSGGNLSYYWKEEEGLSDFLPFCNEVFLFDSIQEEYFNPEFQAKVIEALKCMDSYDANNEIMIDFRSPKAVREMIVYREELVESIPARSIADRESLISLVRYFDYYLKKADLAPELNLIMQRKIEKVRNKDIMEEVKEKFGLEYQESYISTIYTKRVINAINKQAEAHVRLMEYITMGRNAFKNCQECGELLPRNSEFYYRRSSSSDGFTSKCKQCGKR